MKNRITYLGCLLIGLFSWSCQQENLPDPNENRAEALASRATYFSSIAPEKSWKINRLSFATPTVVAERSEDPVNIDSTAITDLYTVLAACRKDDHYDFVFEEGNISINFTDSYTTEASRCNDQEPTFIENGLYLTFNDSLTIAQASFRNNDALHQFFGFQGSRVGSGYLGYGMEWQLMGLFPDSINFKGKFLQRDLPEMNIQFIPLE